MLGEERRCARLERSDGCFASAYIGNRDGPVRRICSDQKGAGFRWRPVERMNDKALVTRMLERGRRLLPLPGGREVGLGVRQRVQLRGAAGKGQRKGNEEAEEEGAGDHANIIRLGLAGYLAPARHWSRPAMNRSFGSFLPMNTITDSFFSFFNQGLPTSPPIIMCTPWNTTRLALPFIHRTPL